MNSDNNFVAKGILFYTFICFIIKNICNYTQNLKKLVHNKDSLDLQE